MSLRRIVSAAGLIAVLALALPPCSVSAATVLGELTDPPDLSLPAHLDILSARCEQAGGQLTFVLLLRGPLPASLPGPDDTATYLWFLDTDENPATGQPHGQLGSEFNVRAVLGQTYGGGYVDVTGGEPGGGGGTVTVAGNEIRIRIWLSEVNSPSDFNWRCASFSVVGGAFFGGNPDTGIVHSDTLPYTPPARVTVTTPILELCPTGTSTGQLEVVLRDAGGNVLPNEEHILTFHSTNEQVATVDSSGLVTAPAVPQEHWQTPYIEVWGDGVMADNSSVIRVTNADLGLVHQSYPAAHVTFCLVPQLEGVNLDSLTAAFQMVEATDRAYAEQTAGVGNMPTGGGTQYLVLDVADDPHTSVCGASGNPIRLGWTWGVPDNNTCYIINAPPVRTPQWFVLWHELGHDFTCSCNSFNLFCMGPSDPHNSAYSEGLASLGALWAWRMILLTPGSLQSTVVADLDGHFLGYAAGWRQGLAQYKQNGADYDQLNPDVVDGILLELYDQYGPKCWFDLFSTFPPPDDPLPVSLDTKEKQATWFVAAFSASAGADLRSTFSSLYGFPIDDSAWPEILSAVQVRVAARTWFPPAEVGGGEPPAPAGVQLLEARPNPFSGAALLRFLLASPGEASLTVHDVGGRKVATLIQAVLPSGEHAVSWDGHDAAGRRAASGVYWARLQAAGRIRQQKLLLVR